MTIYKRASIANKTKGILHTNDVQRLAWMNVQAKIERIQGSRMPFKMRLSALSAISNATAKIY